MSTFIYTVILMLGLLTLTLVLTFHKELRGTYKRRLARRRKLLKTSAERAALKLESINQHSYHP